MPYNKIVISDDAIFEIEKFYTNVSIKYCHTYSIDLMNKNVDDAINAMYQIENGLSRRKPTLYKWRGCYMASYEVDGKVRWNYAYTLNTNENGEVVVTVVDACHGQNMSEFASRSKTFLKTNNITYKRLAKKPLFGYRFVMNPNKLYNLINKEGKLMTQWFKAIKPIPQPYGKHQLIAYLNIGGFLCAFGLDGQTYNLNRSWDDAYTNENYNLQSLLLITEEYLDKYHSPNLIRLTEQDIRKMVLETLIILIENNRKLRV